MNLRGYLAIVGAAVLLGCDTDQPTSAVVSHDSSGVRIVEVGGSAGFELLAARPIPAFSLDEQAPVFHEIRGVVWADSMMFVVLNAGMASVEWYERSGQLVAEHGREGEGPEEYLEPAAIWSTGNSHVEVLDTRLDRITTYTAPGRVGSVRSVVGLPTGRVRHLGRSDGVSVLLDDLMVRIPAQASVAGGEGWDSVRVYALEDREADAIQTMSVSRWQYRIENGASKIVYRPQLSVAVGSGGGRIYVAPGDLSMVQGHTLHGDLVQSIRLRDELDPETAGRAGERIARNVFVDRQGRVWTSGLVGGTRESGLVLWSVFDADGTPSFQVHLPEGFSLQDMWERVLIGVSRDPLDLQTVEVFEIG